MSEKAKHRALVIVVVIETAVIIWLGTSHFWARSYIALLNENRQLLIQTTVKQEEVYGIKIKLGEAYRMTLMRTLEGLGVTVDDRRTAVGMILEAYKQQPDMPTIAPLYVKAKGPSKITGGIGGGRDGE